MVIPKIYVEKMDLELNIKLICRYVNPEFNRKNKSRPFAERTYLLFPDLRGKILDHMDNEEIYKIVKPCVELAFMEKELEIDEKIRKLQTSFDAIQRELITNLIDIFDMKWPVEYERITCYIGCISSFPRNVITKEFFVSYEKDIDYLMMASIHEINHFVLFEKWKQMHGYNNDNEPLYPDTLWFLEEMAVDPTLNITCIQNIAPYPQKAYEQFYECMIDGISAENHIINMFTNRTSIEDFLNRAYDFIDKHKNLLL
ncbi:hypothetical protein [Anaeromicropila herbilytica]|uniref:Uncharacterized protein n=1 Tax=Anaeromicropila herbilytica TaxID=2785025 RepID=A0A7R7ICN9_9FIRM|nr:hypothetical protein [Anaeromicropila herbilytica]BCN30948.1 hypothetical protein bsdtb5_22430 [Anaeromicropila herbilytica]